MFSFGYFMSKIMFYLGRYKVFIFIDYLKETGFKKVRLTVCIRIVADCWLYLSNDKKVGGGYDSRIFLNFGYYFYTLLARVVYSF